MNLSFLKNNIFRLNKRKQVPMNKYILSFLTLIAISSCNESNVIDNKSQFGSNTDSIAKESISTVLNFNYKYPKNIFYSRDEENNTEFYPIGFSPEGNFAYINRACNNFCGCCTHQIIIQDLLTDKIETDLSIANPNEVGNISYIDEWQSNFNKIEKGLKLKGISQSNLKFERTTSFYNNDNNHKYDIKINKKVLKDRPGQSFGPDLAYSVYVTLDNNKTKRITSGKLEAGIDLKFIGFIRSPFNDMIAVVFESESYGIEMDIFNEIIVVGCQLDPSFY